MTPPPVHHCQVFASPWQGVYCTRAESSRRYGKHWHAVYGLGLLDEGAQSSASGRGPVDAYAGDLITTNPGEVHDGQPLGSASRRWRMVYIEPAVLQALADDEGAVAGQAGIALTRPVIQDAALARALHTLVARIALWNVVQPPAPPTAAMAGAVDRLACEESLAQTCALLLQRHASTPPATAPRTAHAAPALGQVRDWLADAPLAPPTLAQMAAFAGLSRYQLLRRFAGTYGLPPHAWLLQQRAERSRHLIGQGVGLADAAAASGFADQSHMTRMFTRQFGFTPGAWQKARRGPAAQ
ncbi:AraC family transcriptional regulator [Acidovorax sp. sif1233]|uniref:AraC family transcriptional regulator n=1 Tax=Acidovorax sp. sif1233 TaxID=2854792 RepID=UPI001C4627E2|nr:AraC family transcriptional regulator [Acidovorax sp. sif1233]MBV7458043.1 AraC family transcriptional regulator [Acidovorax sp. sif1233]